MKGFTLLELLLVIGIIAVLSGFLGSAFVGWQRNQVLTSAVREIVALLNLAKDRAVNQYQGTSWGVRFDNPNSGAPSFVLFQGPTYSSLEDTHVLSAYLTFNFPSKGAFTDVLFQTRTGRPTASTTIEIALASATSTKQTISVSATGVITSD